VWVVISLAAGVVQTVRNGLARSLSGVLPATLLSWSRFAFNLPFAALLLAAWYGLGSEALPSLSSRFFALAAVGGAGQILGNVALLEAFRSGTFAQAIVIHKTEVAVAAVVGFLFFSQRPGAIGWFGIALSVVGVVLIGLVSATPGPTVGGAPPGRLTAARHLFTANRGTALALAAAGLLVVASFGIQQATEELGARNPGVDGTFGFAATTLFHVTWMEVVVLTGWLLARERPALTRVPDHLPRLAGIGLTSFLGSLGWFWAFSLTLVAFVKAVGQVESVLSVVLAIYLWREQRTRDQLPGLALTMVGILLIVST
jgi:drug/metabolite transporter (DMT)-like permease